ncbi:STAS domain-containing protein [Actinomadura miaoliensis]|uniref:STAS domain-containing protein n=1 Tax=Actinomadura miaoliensis TaxID=430685 RepID=A0ABP7V4B2_9ACTN
MERVAILDLQDVLLATIQTQLTDQLALTLQEELLERAAATGARGVIIDISAVEVVDSFLARVLTEIALSVRLLAARTVVAGMRPPVAATLVEMGLDLPGVTTARSLRHALDLLGAAPAAPGAHDQDGR